MDPILREIKKVIKDNNLPDYLKEFPWLTGYLGNPNSAVWFIGENPSLGEVKKQHKRHNDRIDNLQWNSHKGDFLLREALTEVGFKRGDPHSNKGWDCYITNAIKEPEIVKERNERKGKTGYWRKQALLWLPVLQKQLNHGSAKVLVTMGKEARKILDFMKNNGLVTPMVDTIPHYSYIMFRPDRRTRLGPGHPNRIKDFKGSMERIRLQYCAKPLTRAKVHGLPLSGNALSKESKSREFLADVQRFVGIAAVGISAMRNQGKGVLQAVHEYLGGIDLSAVQSLNTRLDFDRWLNFHTEGLLSRLPTRSKRWGAARKALNLFLRDCVYNKYLSSAYEMEKVEQWLEVPLDGWVAKQLEHQAGRGMLPQWPRLKNLEKDVADEFQGFAESLAKRRGTARVHLDIEMWLQGREPVGSKRSINNGG